ncbi:MAG TPA: HlyD family efflux transporter periplasmic adaptor subunit [Caulobacteraceae bacterium]|jgi:HlyD family secretion protein
MKRLAMGIGIVLVLGLLLFLAWRAFAPKPADADVLSGYLEGEAMYLASPQAGSVTSLSVVRGQHIDAGAPLFSIDARSQQAQQDEAVAQLKQSRDQAAAADAAAVQQAANLKAAQVQAANAHRDATRYGDAFASHTGAVSAQETDKAKTAAANADAQVQAAASALANAQAQARAAHAAVGHAGAATEDAAAKLTQLSSRAPSGGQVEETFFQVGEWANANQPIVSLIPDGKVKLKFYVAEGDLSLYRVGRTIRFGCDGCGAVRNATINYVSPRPEFTPPVIYSRKSRDRMVFLIEAAPQGGTTLAPGQPVDVYPLKAAK